MTNFVEIYENLTDEEIVDKINAGNFELLPVIFSRYYSTIFFYTNRYVPSAVSEDAFQEATMALYAAVKDFKAEKATFNTFANLCIKRAIISFLKNSSRKKNVPEEMLSSIDEVEIVDSNSPEKIFFDREDYKSLADTIKLELSELEYKVLQLYLAGEKYSVIAENLSITEKSVDNSLARIRKKLKNFSN